MTPSSSIAEHVVDAALPRRAERVEVRPAGRARVGAERQRLHDVAAAPDPAVADDRDLPADLLGDRLDELDRCRRVVELAATVVRQGDPGHARGDGLLGIGDGLDPLQHDRAVPDRTQPLDVVPRQRRIELRLHLAGERHRRPAVVDALVDDVRERDRFGAEEIERPAGMERAVEDRLESDLRRQREAAADVALASPEHGGVDREPQRLVPGRRRTLDQLTHETPVAPRVDLEPLGTVADGCDLLDRPCRNGRQRVRDAGAVRRLVPPPARPASWRCG